MKVLFDIGHPAHVHFFRNPARLLAQRGHEILITSRHKEMTSVLLDQLGLPHLCISRLGNGGLFALGTELVQRNLALFRTVRHFRPDIMAAIGGVSIAQVGKIAGIPSLVFYDTENARLQNAITYPFASCVIVPRCYEAWLPKRRHIRYNGYHELSYLHPVRFKPNRPTALANGLSAEGETFFTRIVSWQASHDIGEYGWSAELLRQVIQKLTSYGKVLVSSEAQLPADLEAYRYRGKVSEVHHVLAYCRACVGESATMASECAVLGVPAIYAAQTGRGYTNEQETRYHLVRNIRELNWPVLEQALDELLAATQDTWRHARKKLLADTIDVAAFVADCIETFPAPMRAYQEQTS
jgi:predicted glycosyltransferase